MLCFCAWGLLKAQQANFTATVSTDSVLLGNHFQLKFNLRNASGKHFVPPSFEGFEVVSGPNQTAISSIFNGEISQSQSYSYYLKPLDIGNYFIEPARITTDEAVLESPPIEINVFSNPDGVQQNPGIQEQRDFQFFHQEPPARKPKKKVRKKRPIYRI